MKDEAVFWLTLHSQSDSLPLTAEIPPHSCTYLTEVENDTTPIDTLLKRKLVK